MDREKGGCSFWKVWDWHDKLDVVVSPDIEEEPESGCFSERGTSLGGFAGKPGEVTASALHWGALAVAEGLECWSRESELCSQSWGYCDSLCRG